MRYLRGVIHTVRYAMFIRFVVSYRHHTSMRLMGVFQAARRLRDGGGFDLFDEISHDRIVGWFDGRLAVPTRFSRSRRPHAQANAICWFKPDATEHIRRIRSLVRLLEQNAVLTRTLRTTKPGYIVYEDCHQVAAVPFRDTGCPWSTSL
jgi:hypothetical protein